VEFLSVDVIFVGSTWVFDDFSRNTSLEMRRGKDQPTNV
jgi:hypothetical protein